MDELGLDAAEEGVLLVEWPEHAGAGALPQRASAGHGICRRRRSPLDSRRPPAMGGAMAPR